MGMGTSMIVTKSVLAWAGATMKPGYPSLHTTALPRHCPQMQPFYRRISLRPDMTYQLWIKGKSMLNEGPITKGERHVWI